MKICVISDTHMWDMPAEAMPKADVLIHAGDATFRGTTTELEAFNEALGRIKHKYKEIIFTPGNHDWLFERNEITAREIVSNATVLINESHILKHGDREIKIWGSPISPPFGNWAFNLGGFQRNELWNTIPNDTDIVITHGPPKYIGDEVERFDGSIDYTGCPYLHTRLMEVKPLLHICGHIHEGYGVREIGTRTKYINASIMDERYRPSNKPIVVEI